MRSRDKRRRWKRLCREEKENDPPIMRLDDEEKIQRSNNSKLVRLMNDGRVQYYF